jgi:uncharacterized protein involved in outer membrane biogenesis
VLVGAGAVAALLAAFVISVSLGIEVDLDPLRSPFEELASQALDREVRLEGRMLLVPSWSLRLEVHGLRIANPPGWPEPDFARMGLARLRVRMLPLLWGRLAVPEITAEDVGLALARNARGEVNWELGAPSQDPPEQVPEPAAKPAETAQEFLLGSAAIEQLTLRRVCVSLSDARQGTSRTLEVDELIASAATDAPLALSLEGTVLEHPFTVSLEGGDPTQLVTGAGAWPLAVGFEIAATRLRIEAQVDEHEWTLEELVGFAIESGESPFAGLAGRRVGELRVSLEGERLDSLDALLGVSLPPLGPHRFEGRFEAYGASRYQAEVTIGVGTSELRGTLSLDVEPQTPRVELDLAAPSVQLDDFDTGAWTPAASATATREQTGRETAALLSPDTLRRLDGRVAVRVDRVVSGRDRLGAGRFTASLDGGRLALDPLRLEVPGGSMEMKARLGARRRGIDAELQLRVDHFDYGILARRADPETDMAGIFGLDVALRSRAPDAARLMERASGRFDFAVFPEKLEAGIADLWAVNLISAVLPALDSSKNSRVNCVVGLFDMTDGVMTQHVLLADTGRMSVNGVARIDFTTRKVELELAPTPKRPEFFNLATPIRVDGSFEDFAPRVAPEDLLGTVIRFVTSVVHVPIQRLFSRTNDPEDLETCLAALERRRR